MSSTVLSYDNGFMEGSFLMLNLRKSEHFEAKVEKCALNPMNIF